METEQTPHEHKGIKKGLYLIPTAFTAANIAMGFFAVLYSIRGFRATIDNPELAATYFNYAAVAIGFAILFDTLDGRIARMTKTATEIGVQFDSLADVLTFGIAPIALMYSWGLASVFPEGSKELGFATFLLFMYLMCGAFRLARFNIQATRPRVLLEGSQKVDKKNFVGLPIPPAAGLLAAIVHYANPPLSSYGETGHYLAILIMVLLAVLGLLMVSTVRYSSMKAVGSGRNNLYLVLVVAAIGMLMWLYSEYVLLILAVAYVSHGVIWFIFSALMRKRPSQPTEAS